MKVSNSCQDWHPDGSPRTVVIERDGVKTINVLPPKPPETAASVKMRAQMAKQAALNQLMTSPILTAITRIQDAIARYLNPSDPMDDKGFIDEVLAAGDDREVVRAVRELTGKRRTPE